MADFYTFGVVPADIGRYLPRIAFSTDTQPTLADASEIINDHAADICAFLYGMSVNVQALAAAPTSATYRNCQRYILLRFAAQVMRARSQSSTWSRKLLSARAGSSLRSSDTAADKWDDTAEEIRERLRKTPQDLGTTRAVSLTAGNIFHSSADYPETIYRNSILSRSRLAINATQDRM